MVLIEVWRNDNFDVSNELVTVLSLIFTLVSITLSVCEYCLSKYLLNTSAFVMIELEFECNDLKHMRKSEFKHKIMFKNKSKFVSEIARLLKVPSNEIELLKPIHTKNGAIFAFNIEGKLLDLKPIFQIEMANKTVQNVE